MRKTRQERESALPYPYWRLLTKLDHRDFAGSDDVDSEGSVIDTTHRIVMVISIDSQQYCYLSQKQ